MHNRIYLKYEDVVNNYQSVIKYLCRTSNIFTLTPIIRKPYSQMPPSYKYSDELQPFATKYLFYKSEWLVDFLTPWKHQIMAVYRCCKQSRDELLKIPNIFLPDECGAPEDLCFYRDDKLWFATISHEKICFCIGLTDNDIEFFKENGMLINNTGDGAV